jgi:hypothetical protein
MMTDDTSTQAACHKRQSKFVQREKINTGYRKKNYQTAFAVAIGLHEEHVILSRPHKIGLGPEQT